VRDVLQCGAVWCSVVGGAACCGDLSRIAGLLTRVYKCCSVRAVLYCGAVYCSVLQRVAVCCSVLQRLVTNCWPTGMSVAVCVTCCSVLQCVTA